jgi:hypothetical protein
MSDKKPIGQVVLLEPPKEGGSRALVVQGDRVEEGTIGGVKEGQPLNGRDMIQLGPHPQSPIVYNLMERVSFTPDTEDAPDSQEGGRGPAQVASPAYRANYDVIFGGKGGLPN